MAIKDGLSNASTSINSFLMIGQSNMAGRGHFHEVEPINNKLCHMLRMGRWQRMSEPVNPDRDMFNPDWHSGICLAASFADDYAKATEKPVGLIPCADGGTTMDQWAVGGLLYDHALFMTKLAMRTSKLCGILWHQGEGDCGNMEKVNAYKDKFIAMITQLRHDLGDENIPVIIGELGTNIAERHGLGNRPEKLNAVFHEIALELPLCAVASSEGLTLNSDELHFDARSLRTFGHRYFDAYLKLLEQN